MTSGAGDEADSGWPAGWRPMAFGGRPARTVPDPVVEPLWPGRRVLVRVEPAAEPAAGFIAIRDESGLELAGETEIGEALLVAAGSGRLILDGYLVGLPARDAAGLASGSLAVAVPGLAASTRQLVLGGRASGAGSVVGPVNGDAGGLAVADPGGRAPVTGLVAVDLLAIDAEVLLDVPLLERKRLLDACLAAGERVRRGPHVRPPVEGWYGQWRAFGFAAVAVKGANSRYRPGETCDDWAVAPIPRG